MRAAYCYWPIVLLGLYTLVPPRYGNLYFDSFNLLWAIALSYFASRELPTTSRASLDQQASILVDAVSAQPSP